MTRDLGSCWTVLLSLCTASVACWLGAATAPDHETQCGLALSSLFQVAFSSPARALCVLLGSLGLASGWYRLLLPWPWPFLPVTDT